MPAQGPEDLTPAAPGWIIGGLAALQAALWSYGLIVVPAVAAFVSAAAHITTDATWRSAVAVGSSLWVLGHGGPIRVSGSGISLVPLGLSVLAVLTCFGSARRAVRRTPGSLLGFVVTYALVVALVAGAVGASILPTVAGALLIAGLGATTGMIRGDRRDSARRALRPGSARGGELEQRWSEVSAHLPTWAIPSAAVRIGARAACAFLAGLAALGAVIVLVWAVAGRSESRDILTSLGLDATGGLVLAVGQATLVPNLVVWSVAWLSGAGFVVGTASSFAPGSATLGALPALPVLGALPTGGMAGPTMRWAPLLIVALALAVGILVWRRLQTAAGSSEVSWTAMASAVLSLAIVVGVVGGCAVAAASGSAGPGSLAVVGAEAISVARRLAGYAAGGAVVAMVLQHPALRRRVHAAALRIGRSVRPRGGDDADTVG